MGQRGTDERHAKIDEQCKSETLVQCFAIPHGLNGNDGFVLGAQFRKRDQTAPFLASNSRRRRFCQEPGWPRGEWGARHV